MLEPLLFLSSRTAKQVKVDGKLEVFCCCLLLCSSVLLLSVSWALFWSFSLSQSDADGVFLVPQSLACQSRGQQRHLGPEKVKQDVSGLTVLLSFPHQSYADPPGHMTFIGSRLQDENYCTLKSTSRCPVKALTLLLASSYVQERRKTAS